MDKLYFLTGPLQGATAELIGEEITLGRASENGICIDDDSVSDHHAVINRQNGACVLRDLQSARGTKVRGDKVIIVTLEDSDRIAFGAVEAEFTTTEVKLHLPKTAVHSHPSQQPTWPQPRSAPAAEGRSSFKSAVATIMQLAAAAALAYGGYWWYQKLNQAGSTEDVSQTAGATEPPPSAPTALPAPPRQPAVAMPPAPVPQVVAASPVMPEPAKPAPPPPAEARAVTPAATLPPSPSVQQAGIPIAQNKNQDAGVAPEKMPASAVPEPARVPVEPPATPAPASAPVVAAVTSPQPSSAPVELDQLKPEDWVRSLPAPAQSAYLVGSSQQGTARKESLRHWLSIWSKHLRDPDLTLLELDYINQTIQLRDASLNKALKEAREQRDRISQSEWGNIQRTITSKMSDLTSAGNKLMAMNLRSGKQPQLAKLIGESVNHVATERAEMQEIVEHYKYVCRKHRWYYSWYW